MSNYDFDMVEKLRGRASVSYEDAKAALDACGGDLLDALIYLEKQGKVAPPVGGNYTSRAEESHTRTGNNPPPKNDKGETFVEIWGRFLRWCGRVLHAGNTNHFEVRRDEGQVLSVPVTVLILLLIFAFWVTLPLLIIGLFLGCRYSFSGPKTVNISVNGVMDSAANAADALKNEVMGHTGGHGDK